MTAAMNDMRGHLTVDGRDAWSDLGFIVLNGSMEEWFLYPGVKERFSHDWKDEDGIEVDLEHVYLKEKKTSLNFYFVSDSEIEFWNNYKKTLDLLTSPGLRTIYYRAMDKEFSVYYTEASKPKRLKGPKNVAEIVMGMTVHFVMPDPSAMVERLVAPDLIVLVVGDIIGSGMFSYSVSPATASQNVRATITPLTGNAYVAGNMIYAASPGTVKLRVTSAVDSSVYAEKTISVYPQNILMFGYDNEMLSDGVEWITEY
jgi:hypothetical protein